MVMEHRLGHFMTIIDMKGYALARAATQTYHHPGATKEWFIPSQIHNHCLPIDEILLPHPTSVVLQWPSYHSFAACD